MIKVNLKNILGPAAVGMTLLATTVPTWAGAVRTEKVAVKKLGTQFVHAWGTLMGARYSGNRNEFIGCSVEAHVNESPVGGCGASDGAGTSHSGSTADRHKRISLPQISNDCGQATRRERDSAPAAEVKDTRHTFLRNETDYDKAV